MWLWDTFPESTLPPKLYSLLIIYTRASRNLLLLPRIYPQPFSTMWFSQKPPLSLSWMSVHALEGTFISSLGLNVFSESGLWQLVPSTRGCSISGGSRIWRKGGAQGWYILANLGDFLNNLAKIGGGGACCHLVILILPIYVRTLALRWAWRTFYVPAGRGGGCASAPSAPPPAYGPVKYQMLWSLPVENIFHHHKPPIMCH